MSGETGKLLEDFFKSFAITKPVEPLTKSFKDSLPAGYLGELKSGKYENKAFNFSLEVAKDWINVPQAKFEKYPLTEENGSKESFQHTIPIFYLLKRPVGERPFGGLNIVIEKIISRGISLKHLAELDRNSAARNTSAMPSRDLEEEIINGRQFAKFGMELPIAGGILKQMTYFTSIRGYAIVFHLHYFDDAELHELEGFMRTLRFNQ